MVVVQLGMVALELAGCFWCLLAVFLSDEVLQRVEMKLGSGFLVGIPNNLLALSLIWRKVSRSVSVLEASEVVDHELGRNG